MLLHLNERKITKKVSLNVRGNFPMALDTDHHLIFIGTRNPSKLVLFDANSLQMIAGNNISGDADDIFYDRPDSLLFVSCRFRQNRYL